MIENILKQQIIKELVLKKERNIFNEIGKISKSESLQKLSKFPIHNYYLNGSNIENETVEF